MSRRKIYTHVSGDSDSLASIWFASRFLKKDKGEIVSLPFSRERFKNEEDFIFVSADWNGYGLNEDDFALDISAGGHGIKGEVVSEKMVYSCFFKLLIQYGDEETKRVLMNLGRGIDKHDSDPSSRRSENNFNAKDFDNFFSAVQNFKKVLDDEELKNQLFLYLDGFYLRLIDRLNSKQAILASTISVGKTAIFIVSSERGRISNKYDLFELLGFSAKIYVDGKHLGIIVGDDLLKAGLRADNEHVRAVVESAGEADKWFSHESGFMYAWSCEKAPKEQPSKVDPYSLALAFEKARKEHLAEVQK